MTAQFTNHALALFDRSNEVADYAVRGADLAILIENLLVIMSAQLAY